jgi:hypothetical protein
LSAWSCLVVILCAFNYFSPVRRLLLQQQISLRSIWWRYFPCFAFTYCYNIGWKELIDVSLSAWSCLVAILCTFNYFSPVRSLLLQQETVVYCLHSIQKIISFFELHIYSLDMDSMLRWRYVLIDEVEYFVWYHQRCCLTFFCLSLQPEVNIGFIPWLLYFHASRYICISCRCNRKLILASYHDYYTFMLRGTYVSVRNGCHDEENVSFESGNWLLHEFLSILRSLTWTLLVVATGSKLLVSYHEVYTFMLPVACITVRNGCHDRKNVRFESRRWLLHL